MNELVDRAVAADAPAGTEAIDLWREAVTMALYVAICLLAALTAVTDDTLDRRESLELIWGTTLGLALAHWFAFQVSARLVGGGRVRRVDAAGAAAELAGAGVVAVLVTVPVLLFQGAARFDVARAMLAGFIGLVGYAVAVGSGATRARSALYAGTVLIIAMAVVLVKNTLTGH